MFADFCKRCLPSFCPSLSQSWSLSLPWALLQGVVMVEQIKDDHKIVITSNCVFLLGLSQIENDYDSIWYMRHESYQYQYYRYCIFIFGNISASKILWWFVKLKLFCSTLSERFSGQGERVEVRIKRKLSIEIQYNWIWCLKFFWNSHHNRFTLERSIWKKRRPRTLWSQWLRSWKPTSTSGGYFDRTSNNFIEQPPKECLCGLLALCIQRFWFRRRWRGGLFQTTWQLSHESNQISPGERQKLNLINHFCFRTCGSM